MTPAPGGTTMTQPIIRLEHVTRTYHVGDVDVHALRDVSVTVNAGEVQTVTITDAGMNSSYLTGKLTTNEVFATYAPSDPELIKLLKDKNVSFNAKPAQNDSFLSNALLYWLPTLLLIGVWVFLSRQMMHRFGVFNICTAMT